MTIKVQWSVQFAVWRSQNLIKSHFSFGQQIISFKEAKIPLGERKIFFERAKIPLGKQIVKQKVCVNAWFDTTLRGSGCNDIIYANCKTCLNRVDPYERKIPQFVKPKS